MIFVSHKRSEHFLENVLFFLDQKMSQGSPECAVDVIWPLKRKKLNIWPSAVTNFHIESIGISKESYWSCFLLNADFLRYGFISTPLWRYLKKFFLKIRFWPLWIHSLSNFFKFDMEIADIKSFLMNFSITLQTKS